MVKKFHTTIRMTAIGCLVLALAFSPAGAKKDNRGKTRDSSYSTTDSTRSNSTWVVFSSASGSGVIELGADGKSTAGHIPVVHDKVFVTIHSDSLTDYMLEQNLNAVTISVEMFQLMDDSLVFVFSPSGAYFNPSLELTLKKEFVQKDSMLFDEYGEALEYTTEKRGRTQTYFIPHFSRYTYDIYSFMYSY